MTPSHPPGRARLEELLGIEATQKLSPAEEAELDTLLAAFPDQDPGDFELAAAAVHLALLGPLEEMPTALTEKLHLTAVALAPAPVPKRRERPGWVMWSGWAVAAGLAGLAAWALWLKPPEVKEFVREVPVPVPAPPEPPLREQRDKLRPTATAFVGEKKTVTGNIVWNNKDQVGYLEVSGLAPIEAKAGTYQLWIVDGQRPGSAPIDGGVFKVNPDGSALVKIRPPIQVRSAAAFAITKETEPGGVVVSAVKPENYELVLAPPKAG